MNISRKLIVCYCCELLHCDELMEAARPAKISSHYHAKSFAGAAVAWRSLCQYACVAGLSSQVLFELT